MTDQPFADDPSSLSSAAPSPDAMPDRLCLDPKSPFYDKALLERGVGIRFNGAEKTNVYEYCVSEGWIRVVVSNTVNRKGQPMTMMLRGEVEPFIEG